MKNSKASESLKNKLISYKIMEEHFPVSDFKRYIKSFEIREKSKNL